jgi:hypothetical protein
MASSFTVAPRVTTCSSKPTVPTVDGGRHHPTVELWTSRDDDEEDDDLVRVPRRRQRGRFYDDKEADNIFYDAVERRIYGENDRLSDEDDEEGDWVDDEDDDDDDEDEDLGLFSNVLIDNPILDSIDPDGAAERFPELARDPRFWFDMLLFITFLDLLSTIGPQNTFPDIPFYV